MAGAANVRWSELADALQVVAPHACKPGVWDLPILEAVHMRAIRGNVYAFATDRYSVGMLQLPGSAQVGRTQFSVSIPLRELARLVALFRPRRGDPDPMLWINASESEVVRVEEADVASRVGTRLGWPILEGTSVVSSLPKTMLGIVKSLRDDDRPPPTRQEYRPTFMARFGALARRDNLSLEWRQQSPKLDTGAPRATVVTGWDGRFIGALMPVGSGKQTAPVEQALDLWIGRLNESE